MTAALARRRRRIGLRARLIVTILGCVLVSVLAVAGSAYVVLDRQSHNRFRNSASAGIAADADQLRAILRPTTDRGKAVELAQHYLEGRYGLSWALLDGNQGSRAIVVSPDLDFPDDTQTAQIANGTTTVTLGGQQFYSIQQDIGVFGLIVVELYSQRTLRRELGDLRRDMILIGLGVLLIAGLISAGLSRRILRPIRSASAAAERVGSGDLAVRLPVRGEDELADLSTSFNAMTAQLQETLAELRRSDAQQRRFVADVSHELRTPLASLVAAAESLESGDDEVRRRAADLVQRQTHRLADLVADLLEISRFDAGHAEFAPEPVDLGRLAQAVVDGGGVDVAVSGDAEVIGDPRRLHAVVRNLVANAEQHGAAPITVDVTGRADDVVVVVRDRGPGFPDGFAPIAFDRFTRGDAARGNSASNGLGLAIAAENARLHGAALTIEEPVGGVGAAVRLTVPRRPG